MHSLKATTVPQLNNDHYHVSGLGGMATMIYNFMTLDQRCVPFMDKSSHVGTAEEEGSLGYTYHSSKHTLIETFTDVHGLLPRRENFAQ